MKAGYAPQRRLLLELQNERADSPTHPGSPARALRRSDHARRKALSVPDPIRALGEPLGPFFEACGGRRCISLAVRRRDSAALPRTYVFQQPFLLIGRCTESDLRLPHSTVGFRHVYLQLISGRWFFVNLARLSKVASAEREATTGWLDPGQELAIGPYIVRYVSTETSSLTPTVPPVESGDLPRINLELINGRSDPRGPGSRAVTSTITLIGASRQCEVWLRDASVSKIHVSLVLTPGGLWMVDLLGRDGVLIDDRPAYWRQIHEGQELQIGRFRFRVQAEEARVLIPSAQVPPGLAQESSGPATEALAHRGLSEESVLTLVRHLSQMQAQFFEHSQLQMELMTEMLAHLRRSQQDSVRQDLARIDEISRELKSIRRQLDGQHVESPSDRVASPPLSSDATSAQNIPDGDPGDASVIRIDHSALPPQVTDERGPPLPGEREDLRTDAVRSPDADATGQAPKAGEAGSQPTESRTRLTRRMAKLAQERGTRWTRVLQAFQRQPDGS